jgi:hypothetical protein
MIGDTVEEVGDIVGIFLKKNSIAPSDDFKRCVSELFFVSDM